MSYINAVESGFFFFFFFWLNNLKIERERKEKDDPEKGLDKVLRIQESNVLMEFS